MEDREWPAYVAEFIGTFVLVFFICAILSINSAGGIGVTDWAVIGLLHAFVLAMLVYALGGASGAHFNPAVTDHAAGAAQDQARRRARVRARPAVGRRRRVRWSARRS